MTTNSSNTMSPESKITKGDFWKVFFRSCTLDSAWNYERQQHLMYCYMMIPVLKRLYKDDKDGMSEALQRHLEFMSCTPHLVTLLAGISATMEEQNVKDPNFDATSISAVKTSLMGPMAGLGDSFFWGTLLTIAVGIGVSFAQQGSIMGPILFLMIINIPGFLARYFCLKFGFQYGVKFFADMSNSDNRKSYQMCFYFRINGNWRNDCDNSKYANYINCRCWRNHRIFTDISRSDYAMFTTSMCVWNYVLAFR